MDNHKQKPWHSESVERIFERLHTSPAGLSDAEAAERLQQYGRNELRSKPPKTVFQMLKILLNFFKKLLVILTGLIKLCMNLLILLLLLLLMLFLFMKNN